MLKDTVEADARIVEIQKMIEESTNVWLLDIDDEKVIDTFALALIAAQALDKVLKDKVPYCNEQCHADEYEYFTQKIAEFESTCSNPNHSCSEKILEAIEKDTDLEEDSAIHN
jgi:hypothetical protein